MLNTVFFDLDGTLCHPRTRFRAVLAASCAPVFAAHPDLPAEALLYAWSAAIEAPGPSLVAPSLARAFAMCSLVVPQAVVEECAQALLSNWVAEQEWVPGAPDVLETLVGGGVRLGIITNGPSDAQRAVITKLGLERWCRWTLVSGDADIGVRKPEPGVFTLALARAGVAGSSAWFVGDAPVNDIQGAARVGMRTCWFTNEENILPHGVPTPTARISALADLPDVLARFA